MSQIETLKTLANAAIAGNPEVLAVSLAILDACQAEHPITGLRLNHGAHAEMHYLEEHTRRGRERNDQQVSVAYKVLSDVSNLRGLNIILSGGRIGTENDNTQMTREGEQYADKVLAMIGAIYKEEIKKCNGQTYHVGGDEFGANVSELQPKDGWETARPEKLVGAIHAIGKRVRELVVELGLENIMHAKHTTNHDRRGLGIACGYGLLNDRDSLVELDKRFEKLKNSGAFWLRREEEPGHGLPDIMFKAKIEKNAKGGKKRQGDTKTMPHARSGAIYEDFLEVQLSSELLATTRSKIDAKYKDMELDQRKLISHEFPLMQEPLESDAIIRANPVEWINPSIERAHRLSEFKKKHGVSGDEGRLLNSMLALYEQISHPEGICMESPEQLVARYQSVEPHMQGRPMHLIAFDVQNFSGLNKKFGSIGCNGIFEFIQNIIVKECEKTGKPLFSRPMGKGSKIYAMLPGLTNETAVEIIRNINQGVNQAVHRSDLGTLDNPRHRTHNYRQGVKLAVAALPLHEKTQETPQNIMNALEAQLADNIRENTTFNGADLGQLGVIPFSAVTHSHTRKLTRSPRTPPSIGR